MRIMSYNVQVGWGKGIEAVAELIKKYDPDIIAIQEVDIDRKRTGYVDQFKILGDLLGMHGAYACSYSGPEEQGANAQYGHALYSKYPITKENVHKLWVRDRTFPGEAPWINEPRACLQTVTNGIRFFSLHFSTVPDIQRKQAEQLAALIKENNDLPLVALGDFNNSYFSDALEPVNFLNNGLAEIEPAYTYPNGHEAYDDIDHILLSSHFKVLGAQVIFDDEGYSDHNPIICDVELNK